MIVKTLFGFAIIIAILILVIVTTQVVQWIEDEFDGIF